MSNGPSPREMTFRAILLGSVLGIILAAANAYLGLYAGLTVSASIPAAVISMAILRGLLKTGTALENNLVQTIAASGETLAAGVIFTVPALVLTQSWHQFHFWPTTLIAMCGGLLGILFMIPLRRAIIVEEEELTFPEGTACAEVLKAGEGGSGGKTITIAILIAAAYKFFASGIALLQGGIETAFRVGQSLFYFGTESSLALISVGYIVGPNVAILQFLGGIITWIIAIPIYSSVVGIPPGDLVDASWSLWKNQIRYMGVGAMAVGGLWTIWSVRAGLRKGIKRIFGKRVLEEVVARTDQDLSRRYLLPLLLITMTLVFGLYRHLTGSIGVGLYATVLIVIATFFFVAVASYLVGLVGSSNLPISGMTICALLFSAALLHLAGIKGSLGVLAVLGIAGVACGACSSAADISQDLKTGQIVGSTPWKLQIGEVIGSIVPAFVIAPVLTVLHSSYGIGTAVRAGVKPLVAPQATLFAKLSEALFLGEGTLPMTFIYIGMGLAILFILLDNYLKKRNSSFRFYVMAVAMGLYLPFQISATIFLGGLLRKLLVRNNSSEGEGSRGVLIASGLIAGESLMGIIVAAMIFFGMNLPISVWDESGSPAWFSVGIFLIALLLFGFSVRKKK
ncbi:MAG: oligopeptide transporter, OPT family [Deltaproteobacteria bacterium]|nr:oligopeptide transporter, OPT family [Deltaproteobacteria bacterium]